MVSPVSGEGAKVEKMNIKYVEVFISTKILGHREDSCIVSNVGHDNSVDNSRITCRVLTALENTRIKSILLPN